MDDRLGRRRNSGGERGRRVVRVLAVAAALAILPPLKLVTAPAGAAIPAPSVRWEIQYAEAEPYQVASLDGVVSRQRLDDDPADWRIRAGFVLLLLSALGTVTLRLWAGALRRA